MPPKLGKRLRKFDGRVYRRYTSYRKKADAKSTAAHMRKTYSGRRGYHVRVVKTHGMWAVYRRRKRRR